MNRKSKVIKKQAISQKNVLDRYFGKTLKGVIFERLQEEIVEQGFVDGLECVVDVSESVVDVSESVVAASIETFVEENENIEQIAKNESVALKERNDQLEQKCVALTVQNEKLLKDNRALKKMLDAAKSLNLCKDMKIRQLTTQFGVDESKTNNDVGTEKQKKLLFSDHEEHFSDLQLNELRSTGKGKSKDAQFVSKCIEYLYEKNIDKLSEKCSGDRNIRGKSIITPPKKCLMQNMLNERVNSEGLDEQSALERSARLNRLIGDGLYTITKRRVTANKSKIASTETPLQLTSPTLTGTSENFVPQQEFQQQSYLQHTAPDFMQQSYLQHTVQQQQPTQMVPQQFDGFNYVTLPFNFY